MSLDPVTGTLTVVGFIAVVEGLAMWVTKYRTEPVESGRRYIHNHEGP